MCIAFHSLVEKYTIHGGPQIILAFLAFRPFWQSMPMGEEFQRVLWRSLLSFLLALVLVPKHLHLILMHHWLLHCMVMDNSLYKLSWKWLSSITKMGEIERTCGAPMFGFGNWWQSLWTNGCLELYLKVLSIGFSWSTCVGFKESLCRPRCYSRNYLKIGLVRGWSILSQRVNQVDQPTKRRRCTERDQVIPWYGKHCPLHFVY